MKSLPNFLVLHGEDVGRHLGCYGDPVAVTPHLDALAAQGLRFTRAFSTAPVCSPSRSSFITGRYPWAIGTHHHRSELTRAPACFTEHLRTAGYHVAWDGKTDFNFTPAESFCDTRGDWLPALRRGELPASPCFLYRNLAVTHESTMWRCPQEFSSVEERISEWQRFGLDAPTDPARVRVPAYLPDTPEVRGDISRYYDALRIQDAQIGEILAALAASPRVQDTYVIYLSDHGRGLMREKRWCYGPGLHLPLLISGPGLRHGSLAEQLVSWVDLAPSILALAGLTAPTASDGHDIFRVDASPRQVFAGRGRMDEVYDSQRAVTDGRYLYVHNDEPQLPWCQVNGYEHRQLTSQVMREAQSLGRLAGAPAGYFAAAKPPAEFYDLEQDPDCVENRIADSQLRLRRDELAAILAAHRREVNDQGLRSEATLIAAGVLVDQLDALNSRRARPLAASLRGPAPAYSALEMPGHETRSPPIS